MGRSSERLTAFKIIFSSLYQEFSGYNEFVTFVKNENVELSVAQQQLLDNFFFEKQNYIKKIEGSLRLGWTWDRLGKVEQSVLLMALAEHATWKTAKAVIINEAIVTIKKYGVCENYKYINAILDKIIA